MRAARSPADLRVRLCKRVDRVRRRHGCSRLRQDHWLDRLAQAHADAMAGGRVRVGHDGFSERARAIVRVYPGARVSENVAANRGYRRPTRRALRGWLRSRSHRRNLLRRATWTGVGVAIDRTGRCYFVQLFVTPRRA